MDLDSLLEKTETLPKPPEDLSQASLVTHAACMDGAGCAIIFLMLGGKEENIHYVGAGTLRKFVDENHLMKGDRFVIFADVGITSAEDADALEKRGNCVLIDHHLSAKHMQDRSWCYIDCDGNSGSACACKLFLSYMAYSYESWSRVFMENHEILHLTNAIDDNDRWLQKNPRSAEMAAYMTFVGQKRFIKAFIDLSRWGDNFSSLSPNKTIWYEWEETVLEIIQDQKNKNIERLLRDVIVHDIEMDNEMIPVGYVVSSEQNVSQLLMTVLQRFPEVKVAAQISVDKGSISMRSRGDVDVSALAKMFHGGGHRSASGHPLPKNLSKLIIEACHGDW